MIRLFKSAAVRLLGLVVALLIVAAVLSGVLRLALPFADRLREPVEDLIAEALGYGVEMDRLGLSLAGWVPRLRLHGARLVDPQTGVTQLSLAELRLELDPDASVRAMAPRIAALTLVGAHLVVRRDADGRFMVAGLEGLKGGSPGALTFFLRNGRFLLTGSRVDLIDDGPAAPAIGLADVSVRFDNGDGRHRVGAAAVLADAPGTRLRLAGDLTGPAGRLPDWQGSLYARIEGTDLGSLAAGRLPPGLRIESSGGALEAWIDIVGGRPAGVLGRIGADGLTAWRDGADPARRLHLARLSAAVRWQSEEAGWRIEVGDMALAGAGRDHSPGAAELRLARGADGGWTLDGRLDALDLAFAAGLAVLAPDAPDVLADARPRGLARDLSGRFARRGDGSLAWEVRGVLEEVAVAPVGKAPGLTGLAGAFAANRDGGRFDLAAPGLRVDLPLLMRGPIALDTAAGAIRVARAGEGAWRIEAPDLTAANGEISTRSRLFAVTAAGDGRPFLDLQTDFAGVFAGPDVVARYLPVGVLKADLIAWLDHAFPGGRVPEGTLIFRGDPGEFPFRRQQGRFLVDFAVEDAILDYRREWPRIEALEARVRFDGPGLTIEAPDGRLLDSGLSGVAAHIPDLFDARAIHVRGRAEGPFADVLRVLRETPLKARFAAVAAPFRASGSSRLDLDLTLPLRRQAEGGQVSVAGNLTWPAPAALALTGSAVELTGLEGTLRFSDAGVSAEDIRADLWGGPVTLRVETVGEGAGGTGRSTRIQARGRHDSTALAQRLPSPLWQSVQGLVPWDLTIAVRAADLGSGVPPLALALRSDLRGLAVDLPAPLGKTARSVRYLRLDGRLAPGHGLAVTGAYGDIGLGARLATGDDGALALAAVLVRLGGEVTEAPEEGGLAVTGGLATLDLDTWLERGLPAPGSGDGASPGGLSLREADVTIDRLAFGDLALTKLRLRVDPQPPGWRARLEAVELAGTVRLPRRRGAGALEVRLGRLDLAGLLGEPGGTKVGRTPADPADPRRSHALDLRIDDLLWRTNSLGRVEVRVSPRADGLAIDAFDLSGPLMAVRGRGQWTLRDGRPVTELRLAAEGTDLGAFLRLLELKSQLSKAPGSVSLDLAWPGGPADLSLAALSGHAAADIGAGSLLSVEPGVGRMLGVLNLGALQRRLSLDFTDLFDKGYAFEQITASLQVGAGKAVIERLEIDGPSATVNVAGQTDLVGRQFDQIVTVTPRISTGVAVASAVAAGPLVGAAVYLADRVSGGAVDRLGRHEYSITGPWEDPVIRRLGLTGTTAAEPAAGADAPVPAAPAGREPEDENLFLEHH